MTASAIRPRTVHAPKVEEIRAHFPALERVHGGHPVAYFDGPGGTQVPVTVVDAMRDYLLHHNANSHWAYPTSVETDVILDAARAAAADMLNASPNEVAFGANMTTLTFALSRALAPTFAPGDEIVVTELDHHANVAPWTRLAAERGAVIRTARMNTDSGALDWADLEARIGPRTKLLAIGASSNALGTI
ncbi:MAG: aminotransferase class V-fold PLP-dependent enzyme, partial [Gemmatimonadaceae bacterium]|nr:aminotransferase class V-fold PLP-dependent enzyme [Gemmatimonadaceae bacterium]